jgi:hypothetical protein
MQAITFVAAALAVWRVTHLVVLEEGPWQLSHRLRLLGASLGAAKLFGCFLCFSVWAAVPFALLLTRRPLELLLLIPALSGAAILLERATAREETAVPLYVEEAEEEEKKKEESDVLLR